MQSGIAVSETLQTAFADLQADPSKRALLATITSESLTPTNTLASSSQDFKADLARLTPLLEPKTPAYILLRVDTSGLDPFVAVTYVPDAAPVRQKTLFASTRLTLVRELGSEKFRASRFVTEASELEAKGWEAWERHEKGEGPLTREEEELKGVKDALAIRKAGMGKKGSVVSSGVCLQMREGVLDSLEGLRRGEGGNLVVLKINVPEEAIELVETSETDAAGLSAKLSEEEPRFTFFRYRREIEAREDGDVVFIYTCPPRSNVKERMVYACSVRGVLHAANKEAGLEITKRIEASSPSEITATTIEDEFRPQEEQKQSFSRPKRPGRR